MARNVRRQGYGSRPVPMRPRSATTQVVIGLVVIGLLMAALWWVNRPSTSTPTSTSQPTAASSTKSTRAGSTVSTPPAAQQGRDPASGLRWVSLADLPPEASQTMAMIKAGPPYRYPNNDGVVYNNFNGVLPAKAKGYYHEFTVVTPGSSTRGARRIVAGGPERGLSNAEWYYTDDHYDTFERIRP